ncbi:unnamed protein product [Urochloa humidicola]
MIVLMAPRLAPESRPAAVPYLPAGFDLPVTYAVFVALTLWLQLKLARVLQRRPAPAPRLTHFDAWPLAVLTWLFATGCFFSYLRFGDGRYFAHSCYEWAAAGVASAANLAIATRTVMVSSAYTHAFEMIQIFLWGLLIQFVSRS